MDALEPRPRRRSPTDDPIEPEVPRRCPKAPSASQKGRGTAQRLASSWSGRNTSVASRCASCRGSDAASCCSVPPARWPANSPAALTASGATPANSRVWAQQLSRDLPGGLKLGIRDKRRALGRIRPRKMKGKIPSHLAFWRTRLRFRLRAFRPRKYRTHLGREEARRFGCGIPREARHWPARASYGRLRQWQ